MVSSVPRAEDMKPHGVHAGRMRLNFLAVE